MKCSTIVAVADDPFYSLDTNHRLGVRREGGRFPAAVRRLHLWLPPLLYMFLIFYFSSESDPLPELTTRVWDKLLHTAEYGGLGFLMCRAFIGEGISGIRAALVAVVVSSLYGATDEWHQAFVPLRSADILDWLTDSVGSTMGAALYVVTAIVLSGWRAIRAHRSLGVS